MEGFTRIAEVPEIKFDYSSIDTETAKYLRQKEDIIRGIASRTCLDLGRELKETRDRLANYRNGCFEEWYTSLGFKRQTVYNYINYHNFILQQLENKELLESLPKPVVYEAAKPSAPEEIKKGVLSGDIQTIKQLRETKEMLRAAEEIAVNAA